MKTIDLQLVLEFGFSNWILMNVCEFEFGNIYVGSRNYVFTV